MRTVLFDRDSQVLGSVRHGDDGTIQDIVWTEEGQFLSKAANSWKREGIPLFYEQPEADRFVMGKELVAFGDSRAKDALRQWARQNGYLPLELQSYHEVVWERLVALDITADERYRFAAVLSQTPKNEMEGWNKSLSEIV